MVILRKITFSVRLRHKKDYPGRMLGAAFFIKTVSNDAPFKDRNNFLFGKRKRWLYFLHLFLSTMSTYHFIGKVARMVFFRIVTNITRVSLPTTWKPIGRWILNNVKPLFE